MSKIGYTNISTEDPREYRTENKYDPYLIKDTIDTFIDAQLERQVKRKITFSHHFDNRKIIVGLGIVGVLLASHFTPVPFPNNIPVLIACVVTYILLSSYYSKYESKTEGDTFALFSVEDKKSGDSDKNSDSETSTNSAKQPQLYRFNSSLEMYSNKLTLSISTLEAIDTYIVKNEIVVNEFFDQQGYLCTAKLTKVFDAMLNQVKIKKE